MAEVKMSDVKPNSNKFRDERKKMKPMVSKNSRVQNKPTLMNKFIRAFLEEDVEDIKGYIIWEKLVPGFKTAALDVLSMLFFGESYDYRAPKSSGSRKVQYGSFYDKKISRKSSYGGRRSDEKDDKYIDYKRIILRNRREAEDVVSAMQEEIRDMGYATVAQLLELVDAPSKYTDCSWGWDDERDLSVKMVSSGFLIEVADAKNLD